MKKLINNNVIIAILIVLLLVSNGYNTYKTKQIENTVKGQVVSDNVTQENINDVLMSEPVYETVNECVKKQLEKSEVTFELTEEEKEAIRKGIADEIQGIKDEELDELTGEVVNQLKEQTINVIKRDVQAQTTNEIKKLIGTDSTASLSDEEYKKLLVAVEEDVKKNIQDYKISDVQKQEIIRNVDTNTKKYVESKLKDYDNKSDVDKKVKDALKDYAKSSELTSFINTPSFQSAVNNAINNSMVSLRSDMTNLQNQINTVNNTATSGITSLTGDVNTVKSQMITQNSNINNISNTLITKADNSDLLQTQSDLMTLNSQHSILESDYNLFKQQTSVSVNNIQQSINEMRVYVGNDGQLHYVDGAGADTALNFSSNPRIDSINQRNSRPNSNYDYSERWTISRDNTGIKYTVSLSNDNGCHGQWCRVCKKDGTVIASGGRSMTWQGTLNAGDYVQWGQTGGHACTDYYGSVYLIEVVFQK